MQEVDVKKFKRYLAIAGVAVLLFLTLYAAMQQFGGAHLGADFGSFSGDSDYDFGGSDDWGSSDWDSSDDWSSSSSGWGSHDDVYYGGGYSTHSPMISLLFIAVVWVIVIASWYFVLRKFRGSTSGRTVNRRPVTYTDRTQSIRTPDSALTPMEQYNALDPNFDANKLSEKVGNWYVQMQTAWTRKDLSQLRPYFSDALYAQMEQQLQGLVQRHRTNYVDNIAVLGVKLRGYRQTGDVDEIIAEVTTRIKDYTVDDKTGQVVSGSDTAEKFMTYEYSLTRTKGTVTQEQESFTTMTCPHCAAPVNINESAQCPYCGSILTVAQHGWVISGIKGISQQTR